MIHSGARRGFLITTASFSQDTGEFAAGKPITLIDGRYLLAWVNGSTSSRRSESSGKPPAPGLDPYEVLGVPRGASTEEIRAAYLRLIAQYHPDKVMHLGKEFQDLAKEKTQAIVLAYEMLTGSSP
jgi:DnaJ-domain-containing protein 1